MLDVLKEGIKKEVSSLFGVDLADGQMIISPTKKEFEGDYTFVVFPLVKQAKKSPVEIGEALGKALLAHNEQVTSYNVVKGFLNLSMNDDFWSALMEDIATRQEQAPQSVDKTFMVEYCSPNTNKPLHLGHIRNILLGWSMAQIADANGYKVLKTQIINDRGIAICKSMMAWTLQAEGATPESTDTKGDHFVGQYYVAFEKMFQAEYKSWQESEAGKSIFNELGKEGEDATAFFKGYKNKYFNEHSGIGQKTKAMLLKWESGDPEVKALWAKMNGWVYAGFEETHQALGVDFDFNNYESETYILGKQSIDKGLESGVFYKKEDGSVWIDLEDAKMDHKLVLRSDGTSVYMTQDIGTAQTRYEHHKMDELVYVVGDEQDYHFKVLFEIMKRLGEPYADKLYHLSYGMVDLPTGKMKSREGTVVDADDLVAEVINEARQSSEERGGLEGLSEEQKDEVYRKVGLAALKYFIIKVNPRKRMVFDPKESVDMQGQTGPYIQNAYVRIRSIFRKAGDNLALDTSPGKEFAEPEKELLVLMNGYNEIVSEAMVKYDPSLIANFSYALAKAFHRFYHDCPILSLDDESLKNQRLKLSHEVGEMLSHSMRLLGIEMPEYM